MIASPMPSTVTVLIVLWIALPGSVLATSDAQGEQLWRQADELLNQKRYTKALPILTEAAAHGHARAMTTLGNFYQQGVPGIPLNMTTAMGWYQKGAAEGHRFAQYSLGNGYMQGIGGLPVDQARASQLFEASARQGLDDAQQAIAVSYTIGRGVRADRTRALYWLDQSARQGNYMSGAMARMLRNPHTPAFSSDRQLQGFINGVFQHCMVNRFPRYVGRAPDRPDYDLWVTMAPSWRDSYC